MNGQTIDPVRIAMTPNRIPLAIEENNSPVGKPICHKHCGII